MLGQNVVASGVEWSACQEVTAGCGTAWQCVNTASKQAVEGSSPFSRSLFYARKSSDPGMSPGIHCGFLHVPCGRSLVCWFKATPWLSDTRRVRPSGDVIGSSMLRQALDHLSYSRTLPIPSIACLVTRTNVKHASTSALLSLTNENNELHLY